MDNQITIDSLYDYEIENIKEGGLGIVLILNRLSKKNQFDFICQDSLAVYQDKLAAKTFKDDAFMADNKHLFERELNIWLNISDIDNVVSLLKITNIKGKLFALMPCYEYSLRDLLKNEGIIDIERAKFVILSVLSALYYTHKRYSIVHQDIKPENILAKFDKNNRAHFYLSDWGLANIQNIFINKINPNEWLPSAFTEIMSQAGTLPYMSPERFLNTQPNITGDIYSLGMIFFELLIGYLPFDYHSKKTIDLQILSYDYYHNACLILENNLDKKYRDIILKCIDPNVDYRYNCYDSLIKEFS